MISQMCDAAVGGGVKCMTNIVVDMNLFFCDKR